MHDNLFSIIGSLVLLAAAQCVAAQVTDGCAGPAPVGEDGASLLQARGVQALPHGRNEVVNSGASCKDRSKRCIDRAFAGECKTNHSMLKECKLSCGVCSNIWCQSGIYCTSDSSDHSHTSSVRFSQEKCHGYCFKSSCDSTWEKCTQETKINKESAVCSHPSQTDCVVPLEHAPISDKAATDALDKLLLDLGDEPEKMHIIDRNRETILDYITRGIGPESVPKKILPDVGNLSVKNSNRMALLSSTSGCIQQIAAVSADSVFLVASITRLGSLIQRNALSAGLERSVEEVELTALKKMGADSPAASAVFKLGSPGVGPWTKAGATFSIFTSTVSMLSIGQIMKHIRQSLSHVSWWRWLWMGVQVTAQLAAWVLTDGLAFIAQAVGVITQVAHLVSDAVSLGQELKAGCGSSSRRRRTSPPPTTTTTTTSTCPVYKYDYECEQKSGECAELLPAKAALIQDQSLLGNGDLFGTNNTGDEVYSGKIYNRVVQLKMYNSGFDVTDRKTVGKCTGVSNGGLYVLTASHCFQSQYTNPEPADAKFQVTATAQLGKKTKGGAEPAAVKLEWVSIYGVGPDLAIAKLERRIPGMSRLSPTVCLNYREPRPECDTVQFAGFGWPKTKDPDFTLRKAVFSVVSNEGFRTNMGKINHDIEGGDSGGPYFEEKKQHGFSYFQVLGINSLGENDHGAASRMMNLHFIKDHQWTKNYLEEYFVTCCEPRWAKCLT